MTLSHEFRYYLRHRNYLRNVLRETERALDIINNENLFLEDNIVDELLPPLTYNKIQHILENNPAIVIFGQSNQAKAQLVNNLLSTEILPTANGNWRWIKLEYNVTNYISLSLSLEYEVVENLKANEKSWIPIPKEDLAVSDQDDPNCPTVVEAKLRQSKLQDVSIFVTPNTGAVRTLAKGILKILPIFLYSLDDHLLSDENLKELRDLKETYPDSSILFLSSSVPLLKSPKNGKTIESEKRRLKNHNTQTVDLNTTEEKDAEEISPKIDLFLQLQNESKLKNETVRTKLEQLRGLDFPQSDNWKSTDTSWLAGEQYVKITCEKSDKLLSFVNYNLKFFLIGASNCLYKVHTNGVRKFILSAFDKAREIQITPKRIKYAQKMEHGLYTSLMKIVNDKQEELTGLIQNIIHDMKFRVMQSDDFFQYQNVPFEDNERQEWYATVQAATSEVQRYILNRLSERVAEQLVTSVNCLRETFVGTLQRCLLKLEENFEHEASLSASDALRQILSAAYNVELHSLSPSLMHSFLERLRRLFKSLPLPWTPMPILDMSWRKKVTIEVLNSLSAAKLARTISLQFRDKVKASHDAFQAALKSLENRLHGKLERTEEQRKVIRKTHAPKLARLALECTSMCDLITYGLPHVTKEIDRGQFGVVYACDGWGGAPGACAVKSMVPPDGRQWCDLAMEFYYTRTIPNHPRILKLRGSVIDYNYNAGYHAVLLITDRMTMDLQCALQSRMPWLKRIQIAIDVLEGIRYLHSLGLVHRDIKLKNVLLDNDYRAKITDLGFCITGAMMSGSLVGTPVHMAPELMTGHYDSSVDIYAFGICFWYICAGHSSLPFAFEQFDNQEQLWNSVKKGIRPERLRQFDDICWNLMTQCWAGEPSKRPLIGTILPILENLREEAELYDNKFIHKDSDDSEPKGYSRCVLLDSTKNDFCQNEQ